MTQPDNQQAAPEFFGTGLYARQRHPNVGDKWAVFNSEGTLLGDVVMRNGAYAFAVGDIVLTDVALLDIATFCADKSK